MNEKAHISILYNRVKVSHNTRDLPEINYDKEDLVKWLYSNNYRNMFRKWKRSGFETLSAPSLDRLDTTLGYDLNNLELVTWQVNQLRAYSDRMKGVGRMADGNEKVVQLTITGEFVKEYVSISDASRETKINRGNISSAVSGKNKTAGNYIWVRSDEYKVSVESDTNLW